MFLVVSDSWAGAGEMLLVNGEQEGDERETISNASLSSPPRIITLTLSFYLTRRLHLDTYICFQTRSQREMREKQNKNISNLNLRIIVALPW